MTSLTTAPAWVHLLIGVMILLLVGWILQKSRDRFESGLSKRGLHPGAGHAVVTIGTYLFWLAGILILLRVAGLDLSPLTVVAGAFSLGVGFGLQNIIQNFVAGIIILMERPIKTGDRIQAGDVVGEVVSISFRSTVIVTNDNIDVIVPNADFITGKVTNWTQVNRKVRFSVPVGVSYAADPDLVSSILLDIAQEAEGILADPRPDVLFEAFGDSALQFRLRYWTETYTDQPAVLQSHLNREILLRLRAAGIDIPFPQRVVHLESSRGE